MIGVEWGLWYYMSVIQCQMQAIIFMCTGTTKTDKPVFITKGVWISPK